MSPRATKILLATGSAALTLVLVWPLLRGRGERELIVHHSGRADGPVLEVAPPPDAHLPGVLDLERPLYPPSTFQRRPLDEEEIADLFPIESAFIESDPFAYYVNAPDVSEPFDWPEHPAGTLTWRTNSLGLRMDEEPSPERPDLRVLVLGDSHTAGLCNNDETYAARLEDLLGAQRPELAIEVLNAGKSGYSFQHYLGTLERLLPLEPDAVVVALFAGNDFEEGLTLYHLFNQSERPPGIELYQDQVDAAKGVSGPCFSQSFQSLKYFAAQPGQREVALQMARDACTEIAVVCLRRSIPVTFLLIPPPTDVEWEVHAQTLDALRAALDLEGEDLASLDRMTDSLLDFLLRQGFDAIDLRPAFRASEEPLYWLKDNHINLRAQALIAETLAPHLAEVLARAPQRARREPGTTFHARPDSQDALDAPGAPARPDRARSAPHREP